MYQLINKCNVALTATFYSISSTYKENEVCLELMVFSYSYGLNSDICLKAVRVEWQQLCLLHSEISS